jgi:tetratricopeptide (TPR) repeat protein
MREFKRAQQLDPLTINMQGRFAGYYIGSGNPQRAILEYRRAIELDPNFAPNHAHLAALYHNLGMYEEGFAEAQRDFELSGSNHRMNVPHFFCSSRQN